MDTHDSHLSTVLLVDDDEAFLHAVARTIGNSGFRTLTATNYFDALDILDRPEIVIDVLVTDVVLDKGNGFALGRIARYHRKDLKAVYVTAFDVEADEAMGPVLRKPCPAEAVLAAVRDAVGARQTDSA